MSLRSDLNAIKLQLAALEAKLNAVEGRSDKSRKEFLEEFWPAYPRKVAKAAALAAYQKRRNGDTMPPVADLVAAINRQRQGNQWRHGIIPNASTWINGARWEDETPGAVKTMLDRTPREEGATVRFMAKTRARKLGFDCDAIEAADSPQDVLNAFKATTGEEFFE